MIRHDPVLAGFRTMPAPAKEGFLPAVQAVRGVHQDAGLSTLYFRQGAMYKMDRDRTFANG
jgi:hypothetical protein